MKKHLYFWLLLVGLGHIILGVLFVVIAKTPLITPYLENIHNLFYVKYDNANDQLLRTILKLFGATISSWGDVVLSDSTSLCETPRKFC